MTTLSRRSIRSWPVSLAAIASLGGVACDAMGEQQAAQQEPVTAVLKMRESDFVYRSTLNYMTCDDLRNGVAVILRALGARDDVQVRLSNCNMNGVPDLVVSGGGSGSGSGFPQSQGSTWNNSWDRSSRQQSPMERMRNDGAPQQSTPVHIYAMMPVPADSKVMKEIEKDKSRRELISRVTGNMNVAMNDAILFAATRQQVTLSRETIKLGPEHCELLDQMITHVFRDFDLKAVRKSLSCDPHQRSNIPPNAVIEALLPVGYIMPGSDKEKKPAKKDPVPEPQPEAQEQPAPEGQQPSQ